MGLKYPSVPVCHRARMPFYGILKWTVLKSRTSVVPCIAGLNEEYQYIKARGTSGPVRLRVEEGGLIKIARRRPSYLGCCSNMYERFWEPKLAGQMFGLLRQT